MSTCGFRSVRMARSLLWSGIETHGGAQAIHGLNAPAVTVAYGAPRAWWLWDSSYLEASVTVGLFCDKAIPALVPPSLVDQCGPPVCASGPPAGHLGVLRGPDAEFGRTRAMGAAAIDGPPVSEVTPTI